MCRVPMYPFGHMVSLISSRGMVMVVERADLGGVSWVVVGGGGGGGA